jgi:peptidoglycan hydrolase-like protein with peptidoglycan-binding domain
MGAAAEGLQGAARRRRRGWRRAGRTTAGVVAVAAVAGTAAWLLGPEDHGTPAAANDRIPLGAATAQRRDLIDRQDIDGTLGFTGRTTVLAPAAGTITRLRGEGTTVLRGQSLLSIDAQATAWVLYGRRPMYRDLGPGVADGRDVRQLERNLQALGYDPGTVDADWTSATTAAVEAFQGDRGLDETGTLQRSDVVISDGPARVGTHRLGVGDQARAGAPVTALTARAPIVRASIPAEHAGEVHAGDRVEVALPDGRTARGRVSAVGRVASAASQDQSPTVTLTVALSAHDRRKARLDGAPVTVSLETGRTKDALAVPVTALLATAPGAYAVELAGSGRVVPVTLGAFADGWVEVSGRGLDEGARVVVPR